jgi:glycine/D-amino acid oxidase-like deaminating enzyme/nitrite reductase/ring-hydroxylating ferredoxin subunit
MPIAPLERDLTTDVCVVGGGISGITTAYLLVREGRDVVILDAGPIGGGETGQTSAHLSDAIDDTYVEIERLHGPDGARLAASSHTAAINTIETIVQREAVQCGFSRVDGYLFAGPGTAFDELVQERAAAVRAGLDRTEIVRSSPLRSFDTGPCLRFVSQAQFNPLRYLYGLANVLRRNPRASLFSPARAIEIATETRDEGLLEVRIDGDRLVRARSVVVATNAPMSDRFAVHLKQAPYTTYVVGLPITAGRVTRALYWDTADPYHYIRLHEPDVGSGHPILIVGGEDHKAGQRPEGVNPHARLESWARERFPGAGPAEYQWSGQVMETMDGLAFIGPNPSGPPNVYIATGDSGMGLTHGTIAGLLLTDLICGRSNPWAELYDPQRVSVAASSRVVAENLNVAGQYLTWLSRGDVSSEERIPRGEGAVLSRGLHKVAVYRDEAGHLHERSAACPHLGCVVAWNPSDHAWDCPCHGSRFDPFGRVLNGPASVDLRPVEASRKRA